MSSGAGWCYVVVRTWATGIIYSMYPSPIYLPGTVLYFTARQMDFS